MNRNIRSALSLWTLLSITALNALAADHSHATLRVLFLGDRAGHRPAERFASLQPVLAKRDMELVYTENMADLNSANLARFDCLLIYANTTRITPEQEKALFDFVSAGGGLAPIHCATYCFHNSSNYTELVGAQFKRHGTGVFKETIVNAEHPVMQGLAAIESWDETYVHHRHNTNRVVLAERRDETGAEPYTWVREHGKGRVFYTAWGHDQRTWTNANFQTLVEHGIRWASEKSPTKLSPRTGLKPFEFVPSDPLPNYLPSAQFGTQGEPIRTMQKPLPPEESLKHLVTPPGFTPNLFASEPNIFKPTWLAWDERGRVWICETVDYPNELMPENSGRDRVSILEDTDGDGRADKFTVFADKLSIPTGLVLVKGGAIVIHSGRTEFFKDTNGDDKADVRKVLFTGWNMRDTHATASNLRYGFDNWIWGTVGYSGFEGMVGGKQLRFAQGFFRFKPDGSALEYIRPSNNNTWGLGITEDNLIFGSTANNNASMYMPIANRYYEAVNGWSAARVDSIADSQRIYPLTDKVRQVDAHGRFTAGAGSAIYTARNFPKSYWNRFQFVAEPTGHLLGQFVLTATGTDFTAHNARSFAASDDEWTAPICAEVGPDGALWMIDWYNYIVQHNPTPRGFTVGKGAAYETPLRDKIHGRIYRITHADAKPVKAIRLDKVSPKELVAMLKNDNMFWRTHAQRLLVERNKKDIIPALCELVQDNSVDEIGLNPAAIHALWTLKGLGAFDGKKLDAKVGGALTAALTHPSAGVRRAAVMVMPRDEAACKTLLDSKILNDQDAQVRLAALLAFSEIPANVSAGAAAFAALSEPRNAQDRWIPDAIIASGARHDTGFLVAALAGKSSDEASPVLQRVATHYAYRSPQDSVVATLSALPGASTVVATTVLEGLIEGWPTEKPVTLSTSDKQTLTTVMESLPETVRDRLLTLAVKWGQPDLFGASVTTILNSLKQQVADTALKDADRAAAASRLIGLEATTATCKLILDQVTLLTPPDLAIGFINALSESREGRSVSRENPAARNMNRSTPTAEAIIEHWKNFTPTVRRAAIALLIRRPDWAAELLRAVEAKTLSKGDLAAEHWSQLKQNPNRAIAGRAVRLSERGDNNATGREEIVLKLLPLAKEKGDALRGKEVFTANCAVCHSFNGEGKNVGPDLNGIGSRERSDILLEILDPNRSVEANYRSWTVTLNDDESVSGRLESETQTAVEILDTTAKKHVLQRKDIRSLTVSELSIMPTGFETLPADDLKALLEYLTAKH
jgi:putative membrane-bound dehydrogenase-like protein